MAGKKKAAPSAEGGFDFEDVERAAEREEAGVTFPLRDRYGKPMTWTDEDGEERPVTLTVRGALSDSFQQAEAEFNSTYYADGLADVPEGEREAALMDLRTSRDRAHDLAVRAPNIIAWEGFFEGGEPVELTPELAERLIATRWVRPQVVTAQERPERFFDEPSGA